MQGCVRCVLWCTTQSSTAVTMSATSTGDAHMWHTWWAFSVDVATVFLSLFAPPGSWSWHHDPPFQNPSFSDTTHGARPSVTCDGYIDSRMVQSTGRAVGSIYRFTFGCRGHAHVCEVTIGSSTPHMEERPFFSSLSEELRFQDCDQTKLNKELKEREKADAKTHPIFTLLI